MKINVETFRFQEHFQNFVSENPETAALQMIRLLEAAPVALAEETREDAAALASELKEAHIRREINALRRDRTPEKRAQDLRLLNEHFDNECRALDFVRAAAPIPTDPRVLDAQE